MYIHVHAVAGLSGPTMTSFFNVYTLYIPWRHGLAILTLALTKDLHMHMHISSIHECLAFDCTLQFTVATHNQRRSFVGIVSSYSYTM